MQGKNSPGFTLHGLARENDLQGNQIRHYIKSLPELRRLVHKKGGNSTKHSGRPTSLANAKDLCEWVVTECLDNLDKHIVKAAWRRNGYSYFPQEEVQVQVQVQLNIEQDAQLDDEVDISDNNNSSADETLTDTTSETPNNNNK